MGAALPESLGPVPGVRETDAALPLSRPVASAPSGPIRTESRMTADSILSWTPAAVVFDCDGTLMDTERHWEDARDMVLHSYGCAPSDGFAEKARGLHYTECGRLMADVAGRPELTGDMTESLLKHFRELVAADPTTMPGAPELVYSTVQFAPLAVASNCPLEVVESCLGMAGLRDCFSHIVVPDGTTRPKPHPDVYLTAARLCGVDPADTLAVEDSHCGIQAPQARACGYWSRSPPQRQGDGVGRLVGPLAGRAGGAGMGRRPHPCPGHWSHWARDHDGMTAARPAADAMTGRGPGVGESGAPDAPGGRRPWRVGTPAIEGAFAPSWP